MPRAAIMISKIITIPGMLSVAKPECAIIKIKPIFANQTCALNPFFPDFPKRLASIARNDNRSNTDPIMASD